MINSNLRDDLSAEDFLKVLLAGTPLMDVRAPIEFSAGAFPAATNVPLLDDSQRHLVGTQYAEQGQPAAIELGLMLATPEIRQHRLEAWKVFTEANTDGYLYCFRGGLRSRTTQQWLAEHGINYPLVEGGYKALRHCLLKQLERLCKLGRLMVVSGATGVGKTELIQKYSSAIDLEGRALHRGSAFGKMFTEQPAQISWENQIIIDWLRCEAQSNERVLVEAESNQIGKIHITQALQDAMASAPRINLVAPIEERIDRLYSDYVTYKIDHYRNVSVDPWRALEKDVVDNLSKIRKRLGGARYQLLAMQLPTAVANVRAQNDPALFRDIIRNLLTEYYDRQYRHHDDKKRDKILFEGNMAAVKQWLVTEL